MILILIILFGLVFGSFIAAYTYRFGINLSNFKGRSFCDRCKKQIAWWDNIPLFSYLVLGGKCRYCRKKISLRYPLIEFFTALTFASFYLVSYKCLPYSPICLWNSADRPIFYIYFYLIFLLLISIFIIDFENYIIPDELIYLLTLLAAIGIIFMPGINTYDNLFSGFAASSFFLFLHLITNKKGMGLGDVKLAIPIGLLLGGHKSLSWVLLSFILGAVVGVILILLNRKKLKSVVPFGPFLIIAFFLTFFFGYTII